MFKLSNQNQTDPKLSQDWYLSTEKKYLSPKNSTCTAAQNLSYDIESSNSLCAHGILFSFWSLDCSKS